MRENEESIRPNGAENAFAIENAAETERAERRVTTENLWEIIVSLQGTTFYTAKNLPLFLPWNRRAFSLFCLGGGIFYL